MIQQSIANNLLTFLVGRLGPLRTISGEVAAAPTLKPPHRVALAWSKAYRK